jgi:hypothetical protein
MGARSLRRRDGLARTATYTCVRQDGSHKVTLSARLVDHAMRRRHGLPGNSGDDGAAELQGRRRI